ncbi:fatty acyl-AMP ligase [Amycolatopsis sp. H20-H5]|uniref:fatty acyl-AMP ligase n=1 Tax=Amycolatopsis sp. H20-H5 TaxID=3046309 RepID=UPI002DBF435F|nr:fatty acyl-AMP ligase [Amycolatopsis sp. H20-H5]MEC3978423.1 fatty acyl-AMP ligase [Amycolatopsis sp. H20-H5]
MLTSSESVSAARGVAPGGGATTLATLLAERALTVGDEVALTHLDFSLNPHGVASSLTWRELDQRVSAVAGALRAVVEPGHRAAVLIGQTPDYVVAFLGVLRAGLVAVPLFPPDSPGQTERLVGILADSEPTVVLSTADGLHATKTFLSRLETRGHRVIAVDSIPVETGLGFVPHQASAEELAYLQYTSGSTRAPAGVMITHGNVVANARQAAEAYGFVPGEAVAVSWLPLFHDMGLVLAIAAPVAAGIPAVLMDPLAFLEQPVRWLRALSANPGAISAAPNFAYGFCASRVSEEDKVLLRLDHVRSLINGSEPVQAGIIDRFHAAFAECGLSPKTHRSSYGLAEATVLVAVTDAAAPPKVTTFRRPELAMGRVVRAEPGSPHSTTVVSCGHPVEQRVSIVDPDRLRGLPPGQVGEIWVSGPNIGRGYWRRPDESAHTFCALLAEHHRDDAEPQWWLRTGDLGVFFEGELYITGRIKDLVIVDGRNHYPQDIEATAEQAHSAVRPHVAVAFSVPVEDEGEAAVVVVERGRGIAPAAFAPDEIEQAVRRAVSAQHGLAIRTVIVLAPGEVPRTSSGKVARSMCRAKYLAGLLVPEGSR